MNTSPDSSSTTDQPAPPARRARGPLAWIIMLAAVAAIALVLSTLFRAPPHAAETAVGVVQKYDLPDGSVAQLNTNSAIDTAFTATERRVRVVRGQVFFTVAKDPARPFIVTAGGVAVRAVGTAFDVRQRDSTVEVLVTAGRVRVDDASLKRSLLPSSSAPAANEPPLLVAGERAIVPLPSRSSAINAARATVEKVPPAAAQRSLAWQENRLEFDSVPLAEIVEEFNRFNRHRLIIGDAVLAARRFTGTFRADSYDSLVRLLETSFDVTAVRRDTETVLQLRR